LFEELGLRYIGPLDGHDLPGLIRTLQTLRDLHEPLVVHVLTRKGRGYAPAEQAPEDFHGIGSFDPDTGRPRRARAAAQPRSPVLPDTFSAAFGRGLLRRMEQDESIVAITAGMCKGTGLRPVREQMPDRLYDVGIAEEHAVVFAAGLAAAGLRPVVAVYATFMQRAADYVFHDVCLQDLPVVFCLDRAGVVDDGPTHHGIQDIGIWKAFPNLDVLQPADAAELEWMLEAALSRPGPSIIRYPKAPAAPVPVRGLPKPEWGRAAVLREGDAAVIWALGREAVTALEVADILERRGLRIGVVNTRFIRPFDADLLRAQAGRGLPIITLEDHYTTVGLGAIVMETLAGEVARKPLALGWPRAVIQWGTVPGIRRRHGLTPEQIVRKIADYLETVR